MAFDHDSLDFSLVGKIPRFVPLKIGDGNMDFSGERIGVLSGDVGGLRSAFGPLKLALDAGCRVDLCAMAAAGQLLRENKLGLDERIRAGVGFENEVAVVDFVNRGYDLLVVTPSQSLGGLVPAATLAARAILSASCPTLMLQDMYGSAHDALKVLLRSGLLYTLKCLCVSDEFSRDLVAKAGYDLGDRVVVTGGPQFDDVPARLATWPEQRRRLRNEMMVDDEQPVFLVVGGKGGTAEILHLVEDTLVKMKLTDKAVVIFRPHQSAPADDKEASDHYMRSTTYDYFLDVGKDLAPDTNALLPAADYVLSAFGTSNTYGILCGMSGVMYVGTPGCQADLERQKGLKRPPEVEHGAAWYVESPEDLECVIWNVSTPGTSVALRKIREVQAEMAGYNDGHSAERVWQKMQALMAK